jgi:small subunit ribosomal protein S6
MRNYEIMTITKKSLGEEGFSLVSGLIKETIEKNGGNITNSYDWGKRKFAYKMDNDTEGFYEVLNFDLNPAKLSAVKTKLSLIEGLVRYLITAQNTK